MNSHQSRSSSLKLGSPMLIRGRNSPRSWLIPGLQLSTQAGDGGQARLHLEALHGAVHTQEELVEVAGLQFSVSVSVRYQNIARPRLTYVLPLLRMFLSIKWSRLRAQIRCCFLAMKVTKTAGLNLLTPNWVAAAAGSPTQDCELTNDPSFSSFVWRGLRNMSEEKDGDTKPA